MTFRTRYSEYDPSIYASFPEGDSLTQQQFQVECDINNIMAKYRKTGNISHLSRTSPIDGDFTSVEDYQSSLQKVKDAQDAFSQLPALVRDRFANDPSQLMAYLKNPDNLQEAASLGLVTIQTPQKSIEQSMVDALQKNDELREKKTKKD